MSDIENTMSTDVGNGSLKRWIRHLKKACQRKIIRLLWD